MFSSSNVQSAAVLRKSNGATKVGYGGKTVKEKLDEVGDFHVSLLSEVKTLDLAGLKQIVFTGDVTANQNITQIYRRPSFDNPAKAGADPEILGGTLFVYDINGAVFIDIKRPLSRRRRSEGAQSGRHVHIYRWGSPYGGNDWSFIRTPDNYNPSGNPHPFVILNHGNGWIMDGTEALANFSSKTQFGVDSQNGGTYLDTGRADYVQYSSPLIEAFLAEGYVVCGAQNCSDPGDLDAGYGNRETAQSIWLFFQHVVENFNVLRYCHMIGASNGCIATLNATKMMGRDRVRSITLLYPLINLHAAWEGAYESQIADAYNFSANPSSFPAFAGGTRGFDPMVSDTDYSFFLDENGSEDDYRDADAFAFYADGVTGEALLRRENTLIDSAAVATDGLPLDTIMLYRRSIYPWPRSRGHYSLSDSVTPPELHWLAFQKLLQRGGHVNFSYEASGSHGDYTHFEGSDGTLITSIINWTKL